RFRLGRRAAAGGLLWFLVAFGGGCFSGRFGRIGGLLAGALRRFSLSRGFGGGGFGSCSLGLGGLRAAARRLLFGRCFRYFSGCGGFGFGGGSRLFGGLLANAGAS